MTVCDHEDAAAAPPTLTGSDAGWLDMKATREFPHDAWWVDPGSWSVNDRIRHAL